MKNDPNMEIDTKELKLADGTIIMQIYLTDVPDAPDGAKNAEITLSTHDRHNNHEALSFGLSFLCCRSFVLSIMSAYKKWEYISPEQKNSVENLLRSLEEINDFIFPDSVIIRGTI